MLDARGRFICPLCGWHYSRGRPDNPLADDPLGERMLVLDHIETHTSIEYIFYINELLDELDEAGKRVGVRKGPRVRDIDAEVAKHIDALSGRATYYEEAIKNGQSVTVEDEVFDAPVRVPLQERPRVRGEEEPGGQAARKVP